MAHLVTGKVRLSYEHIWEPASINDSDEKYSVSLIIPKSDTKTVKDIQNAVEQAKQDGKAKFGGRIPANLKLPLRDGDIERPDDEAYKDCYFINCNSKDKPQIVDKNVQPILDRNEVYSGCYARVSISLYPFNTNGNKGIACGLGLRQCTLNSCVFREVVPLRDRQWIRLGTGKIQSVMCRSVRK